MIEFSLNKSNTVKRSWINMNTATSSSTRLDFSIKNTSGKTLVFESEHGVAAKKGSTETNKSTTLFLCFGDVLSRMDIEKMSPIYKNVWTSTVELREENGKALHYLAIAPTKAIRLENGGILDLTLQAPKARVNGFSQLSVEIDSLKIAEENTIVEAGETSFYFSLNGRAEKTLKLKSGIVGDDSVYLSKNGSIKNKFTVFLLNEMGEELDLGNKPETKLRLSFGDSFKYTDIELVDGKPDSTGKFLEFPLKGVWKENAVKELKFTCTMTKDDGVLKTNGELVTYLKIEVLEVNGFHDVTFYVPIKLMLQKQIGSESFPIQIDNETIHFK